MGAGLIVYAFERQAWVAGGAGGALLVRALANATFRRIAWSLAHDVCRRRGAASETTPQLTA
jgi:hypothetical protein